MTDAIELTTQTAIERVTRDVNQFVTQGSQCGGPVSACPFGETDVEDSEFHFFSHTKSAVRTASDSTGIPRNLRARRGRAERIRSSGYASTRSTSIRKPPRSTASRTSW